MVAFDKSGLGGIDKNDETKNNNSIQLFRNINYYFGDILEPMVHGDRIKNPKMFENINLPFVKYYYYHQYYHYSNYYYYYF